MQQQCWQLECSPLPDEDPGAAQGALLHSVARAMALVEPAGQAVAAGVAGLAEVVAAAVRAIQAMEATSEDRHHAAAVAADARVDRVLRDADVVRVVGGRGFPCFRNGSHVAALRLLAAELVLPRELLLHVLLQFYANGGERAGVIHTADAAAVARPGGRTPLTHEVPAVHRHGLVQQLLAYRAG